MLRSIDRKKVLYLPPLQMACHSFFMPARRIGCEPATSAPFRFLLLICLKNRHSFAILTWWGFSTTFLEELKGCCCLRRHELSHAFRELRILSSLIWLLATKDLHELTSCGN